MNKIIILVLSVLIAGSGAFALPPALTLDIAAHVAKPPVLDGKLDDPCWQTLPKNSTFYKFMAQIPTPTPLETERQLGFDSRGLYLGLRLAEKNIGKIKAFITQRDDPELWRDDCVEIYFDHEGASISYRKFIVNSLGTRTDLYQMDPANIDTTWSPDGWQVRTSRDDQAWYIEAFFPWDNLGAAAKDGALWRFALCRFSWSSGNLATSAVGAMYSMPNRFGWLVFLDAVPDNPDRLADTLAAGIPGDWIWFARGQSIIKTGNHAQAMPASALLIEQRDRLRAVAAECAALEKIMPPRGSNTCAALSARLDAVPVRVADGVAFQQSVQALQELDRAFEDIKYTGLLVELAQTAERLSRARSEK